MLLTMAAVAVGKEMDPTGFSVKVTLTPSSDGRDGASLDSEIRLSDQYSSREQRILCNAARSCEVHHILRGPITLRETVRVG
jgi:hypothetical protein